MDYQTIIVEEKNAVGYLTFNRPHSRTEISFNHPIQRQRE